MRALRFAAKGQVDRIIPEGLAHARIAEVFDVRETHAIEQRARHEARLGLIPRKDGACNGLQVVICDTRAKRTLTFSYARQRKRYGEIVECTPSRFLSELPEEDLAWEGRESVAAPGADGVRADDHLRHLRNLLGTS